MCSGSHRAAIVKELEKVQDNMRVRMATYVNAWLSADLDTILSYFVDDGLDYSDYGLMALHMDKKALVEYFKFMGTAFGDIKLETTGVHGTKDFCVWECVFEFTLLEDVPAVPYVKGERAKLFNASMMHWNKDGKIYKESAYAIWANAPSLQH